MKRRRRTETALLPQLRQDLSSLDSRLTIGQIQTMKQLIARFIVGLNLFNVILGGFGFLALVLAAIGTYGVQACDVAKRSHEIGVRLAMGSPRSRPGLFLRQGVVLGVIGLAIGTPGVIRDRHVRAQPAHRVLAAADFAHGRRGDDALPLDAGGHRVPPAWRATRCDPASVPRRE